jgi:hypothetical protein
MKGFHRYLALGVGLAAAFPLSAQGLAITTPQASVKFGFLFQPQYEAVGNPTVDGMTQNLFMRRMRLYMVGTVGTDWEFWIDTDSTNMGKSNTDGTRINMSPNGNLVLQDAYITYKITPTLKLDAGLTLMPLAHQTNQGATSLMSVDYGSYAFLSNGGLANNTVRDTGLLLRGLAWNHLDYRIGIAQGKRSAQLIDQPDPTLNHVASNNPMRVSGRVQYNFFDAEATANAYYAGTYFGTKRILSIGVGHDKQDDYKATAFDVFFDWPVGNDSVTFQADHWDWDGGTWIPTLTKRKTLFSEAGYRFGGSNLMPYARYEFQHPDLATKAALKEDRMGGGLAWWIKGHTSNLKVQYLRVQPSAPGVTLKDYDQVNVQLQLFFL